MNDELASLSTLWPPVLEAAVRLAARAHYHQFRKRSPGGEDCDGGPDALAEGCIPYITHLVGTATILARAGAESGVIAAGLLHDLLEDVPEAGGETAIRHAAGERVLALVLAVTEDKERDRPAAESWEHRKAEQLEHLATAHRDVVLIKAADALHNLLSLIADLEAADAAPTVWDRFNAPPERQLLYFGELSRVVCHRLPGHPIAVELASAVETLRAQRP
ncbi:MAG: bifunctional (p)ppGpp synthetase/guanosine-3',5'-bis(diphosphate) 3'-pyrophosphohydrolase [Acidobacteria bacterium]|nr:bifunctional (p)ppGpp synthetase/guanosine-3',5'-bis(diphosphate) 3'-pyrophosphohydrolase [Acidobacteriota bacterium]